MNILLTGSTGLIGSALTQYLTTQGHDIYPLYRKPSIKKPHYWNPDKDQIHLDDEIKIDAVIHLAGENIADSRWNQKKKDAILNSRVNGTRLIAEAISRAKHRPALFISGSAIGYYGETGENIVDETAPRGQGFMSDIAAQWEAATQTAEAAGIRTLHIRTGIVLSPDGGVLQKMLLPFRLGLGGIIGDGRQYMSWISINDVLHIIDYMLDNNQLSGPYNLVAPCPVTNRTFTKCLGSVLQRPTLLPLPAFIARLMFGEMADALLLSSTRVLPKKLLDSGYTFIDSDFESSLKSLLNKQE